MRIVYMDSGTSNTRAYLLEDAVLRDTAKAAVGTKDSAITGSNDVLLRGIKALYDELLSRNGLVDADIGAIWMSGMVTNGFGIHEVPHMSLPVDAKKAHDEAYRYFEGEFFNRNLMLIRGAKTTAPDAVITMDNIECVGNVRGEEIEIIGMTGSDLVPLGASFVVISPGSHTHICYVRGGQLTDIISTFTGELNYAIASQTILAGELAHGDIGMDRETVLAGYTNLKKYGMVRALYIIHASKVFEACSDEARSQMLAGAIAGGAADLLAGKLEAEWRDAKKVIIIGGKGYVDSYKYILEQAVDVPVMVENGIGEKSFALAGFLEILKQKN